MPFQEEMTIFLFSLYTFLYKWDIQGKSINIQLTAEIYYLKWVFYHILVTQVGLKIFSKIIFLLLVSNSIFSIFLRSDPKNDVENFVSKKQHFFSRPEIKKITHTNYSIGSQATFLCDGFCIRAFQKKCCLFLTFSRLLTENLTEITKRDGIFTYNKLHLVMTVDMTTLHLLEV